MSDFVPRVFDGLAALTRELMDSATQNNWLQIDNPDKEREQGDAKPRNDRSLSRADGRTSALPDKAQAQRPNRERIDPRSPATGRFVRSDPARPASDYAPARGAAATPTPLQKPHQPVGHAGSRQAPMLATLMIAPATASFPQNTTRSTLAATTALPSQVTKPASATHTLFSAQQAAVSGSAATQVLETNALITRIERVLLASGPQSAAQDLHAAMRSLSPAAASAFLEASRPVMTAILDQTCRSAPKVIEAMPVANTGEPRQTMTRTALTLAHFSAAIDKDPRSPAAMRLAQDLGAVVLASTTPNDKTVFGALVQGIAVGAGPKLALAVAAQLAHHHQDPSRARSYLAQMIAAFARLSERIDDAHDAMLDHLGPLLVDWTVWRAGAPGEALTALMDFVAAQPDFLEKLQPPLDRAEKAGLEGFRALRDLAPPYWDAGLQKVHAQLLESDSVFGAIAGSRLVLREIQAMATPAIEAESGPTLDAVKLVLTRIGFDAPRAAFLANLSEIGGGSMLGSGWTALESFERMETHGRAFQQLLAFLNGRYQVAQTLAVIGFEDVDATPGGAHRD